MCPPPCANRFKYLESPLSQPPYLELFQSKGGAVEAFLGRASLETFSGETRLKKPPCSLTHSYEKHVRRQQLQEALSGNKDPKDHKYSKESGLARRRFFATSISRITKIERIPKIQRIPRITRRGGIPRITRRGRKEAWQGERWWQRGPLQSSGQTLHCRQLLQLLATSAPALAPGTPPPPWHQPWPSSCPSEP